MKHLKKWMFIFGLLGLILSGCGTSENKDDDANGSNQTQNEEINKESQENQNTDTEQEPVEQKNDEQTKEDEGVVRILEQNLQYTLNDEAKEETAFLKSSDNQPYSMYVLPEFELTAEEPNKDVIYLTENDHIFMRIELLPEDVQWDMMEENTKAQLQAVDETIHPIEVPSGDEFFKDSIAMEASNGDDVVTSYLIKNSDQPIKLSLFTKKNLDYKDAFLQMGKTILKNK
ncbi:hypothetical protein RRV45_08310 [Bacillus sp. DTU_2020_1000418_1_SI_GHA_SEK_038]|uniref:hypothetical protein n=1 Tax=Bacillus sp. DTU_2020_1000418_1_SI_GHA_SEK_038 TaxID=3077585 RepID=UPI0028EFB1EE|nr:hypothetical protein [Bacillus sp. DTU_2020_1000418_1_SI_GHA_SEK_038]WNS76972.1 hypothetical protein RRV45_08310 [Bacillus sp. DTU_2020_1000418_1_SI_GHA_SEK_038]